MINKDILDELDRLGFGADVDALETYIAKLQDAHAMGDSLVDDSVYDAHVRLLKKVKPDSSVLSRNWELEDNELTEYDELLKKYGMASITTITDYDELYKFKNILDKIGKPIELMGSIKENGHAVRAVYLNGNLYTGSTRGRYKKGRDITRHLKLLLPNYVEAWRNTKIVEIRGEMLVSIDTFEEKLRGTLKTPLSSVTSLIRESASDEEIKLMDMVCFKVLTSDDSLGLNTLWDEYEHLKECGFKTPEKAKIQGVTSGNLEQAVDILVDYFEGLMDNGELKYACDGVIVSINDSDLFYSMGKNGNNWNSNFALKLGRYWESNVYSSTILDVEFTPGKSYMTPKAIVEPVVTANGSTVTTVPLYNIGVMERYEYVPGETIYFRYGGETGVSCCTYDGRSVQA